MISTNKCDRGRPDETGGGGGGRKNRLTATTLRSKMKSNCQTYQERSGGKNTIYLLIYKAEAVTLW